MQAFIARAVSAIYREAELWILEAGMLLADRVNQKTDGTAAVSATVPFDVLALLERSSCQINFTRAEESLPLHSEWAVRLPRGLESARDRAARRFRCAAGVPDGCRSRRPCPGRARRSGQP